MSLGKSVRQKENRPQCKIHLLSSTFCSSSQSLLKLHRGCALLMEKLRQKGTISEPRSQTKSSAEQRSDTSTLTPWPLIPAGLSSPRPSLFPESCLLTLLSEQKAGPGGAAPQEWFIGKVCSQRSPALRAAGKCPGSGSCSSHPLLQPFPCHPPLLPGTATPGPLSPFSLGPHHLTATSMSPTQLPPPPAVS